MSKEDDRSAAESLILRVHTIDGETHNIRQYVGPGVEREFCNRIPQELANGMWVDDRTFIPPNAIIRAEIIVGKAAEFPQPRVDE